MRIKWLQVLFAVALIFNIVFSLSAGLNQMPKFDDIWNYQLVTSIDEHSVPLLYWGEGEGYKYGASSDLVNGMIHPPLGPYSLYFLYSVFGGLYVLRLLGVVVTLLSVWLIFAISGLLYSDSKRGRYVGYLASVIFLFSHLAVQKSMLQSVDTLFYPVLIGLFVYLFLKYEDNWLLFGLLFGITLLFKYTTVPFVVVAMFVYYLLDGSFWKGVKVCFLTSVIGVGLFLLGLGLYSYQFDQSFWFVIEYTLFSRVLSGSGGYLKHLLTAVAYDTFWLSPYLGLVFVVAVLRRVFRYFREFKMEQIDFLWILVCGVWFAYSIKAPDIYYKYPMFLLMVIVVAHFLVRLGKLSFAGIVSGGLVFGFLFYVLPDPFLILPGLLPFGVGTVSGLAVLGMYFVPFIVLLFVSSREYATVLVVLMIGFFLSMNVMQYDAPHSTIMLYGESGYEDTIMWLQQNLNPDELYVARWDIGYNVGGKFFPDDRFTVRNLCGIDNSLVDRGASPCGQITSGYDVEHLRVFEDNDIGVVVHSSFFDEHDGGFISEMKELLSREYILEERFGHFSIYTK